MSIYSGDEDCGDEITSGLPSLEEPEGQCCPQCGEPLRFTGYCGACGWRGDQ